MSAWAELVNADGSDEWLELCSRALEEVQRETSRRNAARVRAEKDSWPQAAQRVAIACVADRIDPEVA